MKKKVWYFQTKLILIQVFLVFPMLALLLIVSLYWMRSSAMDAIEQSRNDSIKTAADAFDQIYLRMIKLLEKPYTDTELYKIMILEYAASDGGTKNRNDLQTNKLLNNIIYYEPDIASITLVLDATNSVYYKRRAPSVSVNVHNKDWYHLTQSSWYVEAMKTDSYVVMPAVKDELYINSGLTIPITQRLMNMLADQRVGVFRIDIGIENFYAGWTQIVQNPQKDILAVLDAQNSLIFCSSEEYIKTNPLLTKIDMDSFSEKYHYNTYTAPASGLQFFYLSGDYSVLDLKQPLFLVGTVLMVFYILYAFLFIKWSSRYISSPINKLKTAMIMGQENKLWIRCEPLAGEMGDLSDAFNQLMVRMEELIEDATLHEQEKARLAYEVLQSKINPHFLYNTLNAIRYKADIMGAQNISHALESLASLLRFTIKCTDEVIPFETELKQLENYIQIMRIRYGDEIEIDFDIDEECFQYKCMKFLIQPIIENCFVHAFTSEKKQQNIVLVKIVCAEDEIAVTVSDNGTGIGEEQIRQLMKQQSPEAKSKFFGIGMDNVIQRIDTLFGRPYTLRIESELGKYTNVTAVIPKLDLDGESGAKDYISERSYHDNINL